MMICFSISNLLWGGGGKKCALCFIIVTPYTVCQICPQGPAHTPIVRPCRHHLTSPGFSHTVPSSSPERSLPSSGLLLRLSSPWNAIPPIFPGQLLTFAFCRLRLKCHLFRGHLNTPFLILVHCPHNTYSCFIPLLLAFIPLHWAANSMKSGDTYRLLFCPSTQPTP